VRRLLGRSQLAAQDFRQAYDLLEKNDRVGAECFVLCAGVSHVL
jgi:hypothetical protein